MNGVKLNFSTSSAQYGDSRIDLYSHFRNCISSLGLKARELNWVTSKFNYVKLNLIWVNWTELNWIEFLIKRVLYGCAEVQRLYEFRNINMNKKNKINKNRQLILSALYDNILVEPSAGSPMMSADVKPLLLCQQSGQYAHILGAWWFSL